MNKVIMMGRPTRDPEVNYGANGDAYARFNLAVRRRYQKDGTPDADFVSCVCFGKTAEFVESYITKGMRIICEGRIQTGSYDDSEGVTHYTTDVVLENIEFADSKKEEQEPDITPPKNAKPKSAPNKRR